MRTYTKAEYEIAMKELKEIQCLAREVIRKNGGKDIRFVKEGGDGSGAAVRNEQIVGNREKER